MKTAKKNNATESALLTSLDEFISTSINFHRQKQPHTDTNTPAYTESQFVWFSRAAPFLSPMHWVTEWGTCFLFTNHKIFCPDAQTCVKKHR